MTRIAYVSTYVPKKCGLATYTFHLRQAVNQAENWKKHDQVIAITNNEEVDQFNSMPSLFTLVKDDKKQYAKMAQKLNHSNVEVVSLQHEFGIFGGEAGEYILDFIHHLNKPLVTTFHTLFEHPQPPYASIQREIAQKSDHIIVMNRKGIDFLHHSFGIRRDKITFIPHGTPQPVPEKRQQYREQLGWNGRKIMMTFGLLSRGKGLERIIEVLPDIVQHVPEALYVIVGQTHPEVKRREGEQYRDQLRKQIKSLQLESHVAMVDQYVDEHDLIKHITAADLYVTPYPGMQQITSGTLAYAVGLGRPILSTPYVYAKDLLNEYPELLIPFEDKQSWADKIISILGNDSELAKWEKRMHELGSRMHWPEVGKQHLELFTKVKEEHTVVQG